MYGITCYLNLLYVMYNQVIKYGLCTAYPGNKIWFMYSTTCYLNLVHVRYNLLLKPSEKSEKWIQPGALRDL